MPQTVWKTTLASQDVQHILIPAGAELLCAGEQFEQMAVWYRCDPGAPKESRRIAICGTGHPCPTSREGRYLGTARLMGGRMIFHIFERMTDTREQS